MCTMYYVVMLTSFSPHYEATNITDCGRSMDYVWPELTYPCSIYFFCIEYKFDVSCILFWIMVDPYYIKTIFFFRKLDINKLNVTLLSRCRSTGKELCAYK